MFNLYPKIQNAIQDRSAKEGWVTLLSLITMCFLIGSELMLFGVKSDRADARVEPHRADEIVVHLDLELTHVTCDSTKLFAISVLQARSKEIERYFVTIRQRIELFDRWTDQFSYSDIADGGGCRIVGATRIPKLPGSIQVAIKEGTRGKQTGNEPFPNLSHKVHHLAFTDEVDAPEHLKLASGFGHTKTNLQGFSGTDIFSAAGPVDQEEGIHTDDNLSHDYGLQLVPTITTDGQWSYQYTWTEAIWKDDASPSVTFHLELSPITMKFHYQYSTLYEKFISISTILGGVYVMFVPLGMLV